MERVIIWVINSNANSQFIDIEVFEGRNRFTKMGLFSGPLYPLNLEKKSNLDKIVTLIPTQNVTLIGKNKYRTYKENISLFCKIWKEQNIESVYYRLDDKKLHRISNFIPQTRGTELKNKEFLYYKKTGEFKYKCSSEENEIEDHGKLSLIPETRLYLYSKNKKIEGYLCFAYHGVELPLNIKQETIQTSDGVIFRNLQYEWNITEKLIELGGHKGIHHEITFPEKTFFSKILPKLQRLEMLLFWGKDKKKISKSSFACGISYNINWFEISGTVKGENTTYKLSDLLRMSKGRSYVEIDNGILFLPKELSGLAAYSIKNGDIQIPAKKLADVNAVAERFQIDPSIYLKQFSSAILSEYKILPAWDSILMPYQKEGVIWMNAMYQKGFGCCLADDMGLGKTLQAIAFLCGREKKKNAPVLIVVPKIILYNWGNEIKRFAPGEKYRFIYESFDYSSTLENDCLYITTYETLINHEDYFQKQQYDSIVLDEAHYIKNYKTQRYKVLQKLETKFMLALTGTPIENSVEELWSLLNMLNPKLFGTHVEFMEKFGDVHEDENHMKHLKIITTPFILRRTKEQVLKELPERTEKNIYCTMNPEQRKKYEMLVSSIQNELNEKPSRYVIKDNAAVLQALLYLREFCTDPQMLPPGMGELRTGGSCKFDVFQEYAETIVKENGKLIVYSLFPSALKYLKIWCEQKGWKTFYIDGTSNHRQDIVDQFEQEQQGIFFISLKAGGVGLNLVSCQYVIIYDPWWNSSAEQQAADRVYRIGQKKAVFIYHFLTKDSIEEKIYELQKQKKLLADTALDQDGGMPGLSMEDLYKLLY